MNLRDIAEAQHKAVRPNHSICVYGNPKTGKTRLVGTAAKIPEITRIVWFDLENGSETLLHMGLTPEEMAKVELIKITDTRTEPRAAECLLKFISSPTGFHICEEHSKPNCLPCKKDNKFTGTYVNITKMTHSELLVIDSGSQLGDSCLNLATLGQDVDYKAKMDDWGALGKYLGDILSVFQASRFTNTVVITHLLPVEEKVNGITRDKFYPLIGTKKFSMKSGKYFGSLILTEIGMKKHKAGSSSTYKTDYITGSRTNAKIESGAEPDMRSILVEGGVL